MIKRITGLPPEYQEIYDNLVMPVDTDIRIESVILSEENQNKIQTFIKEVKYRDKMLEYGLTPMNRILMYGASGCGKTYLTKALSNYFNYPMIYIDIAQALSENTVAQNLSDLFKLAAYFDKCLLFLDECDSIAWNRDSSQNDSGTVRRATNSLFQHLDQMSPNAIFVSCTNMLHRLDAAFERRFHMKMEFRKPQLNISECIPKFMLPKFTLDDNVDSLAREIIERRASQNAKLSYYEIEQIVQRAMKRAIINDTNIVRSSDIYEDLAVAMKVKLRFGTGEDDEEIFHTGESSY